jgi:hypothetical protein
MSLKWESFANESFKFTYRSQDWTYALDINVACPCHVHKGFFYSLQLIVCDYVLLYTVHCTVYSVQ